MSEHHVLVERIDRIEEHGNAGALEVAWVKGYPVLVKKGKYRPGDLATYIPVDAVVPEGEEFAEVYKYTHKGRIKAAKLRGRLSMGLLWRVPAGAAEGDGVADALGITKYEPPLTAFGKVSYLPADSIPDPGLLPKYDIEGYRRWPNVLREGEEVVITEKLHGCNARFLVDYDGTFWVGSRNLMVKPGGDSMWAQVARQYELQVRLSAFTGRGLGLYGEVVGVQDLMYSLKPGEFGLRVFDAYDVNEGQWLHYDSLQSLLGDLALLPAPVLYRGPWSEDLVSLAEGESTLAEHVREGIVIRPTTERYYGALGRVQLKLAGEGYLLRKGG